MAAEIDILLWITWGFGVFVVAMALSPIIRDNRRSYSAMTSNFIKLIVIMAFMQGCGFVVKYVYGDVFGLVEPILQKNLRIDFIVLLGVLAVMLHFTLYALGLHRHYGLPWIWYIFILTYFIQLGYTDIDVPVISSAIVAGGLVVLYFYKAFKNRAGLMFGIACYIIVNIIFALLNQYVAANLTSEEICDLLGFLCGNIAIALGTWNVYDRYLLYDRAREKAIKSTWIAKLMQPAINASGHATTELMQVRRHVTCPVCNAEATWDFPADLIQLRRQTTRAIMLVNVPAGTTCDHEYGMYVSQTFDILGYKV